jgi:hypothetical protein
MDSTALQNKVDTLTAQVQQEATALQTDQEALTEAQAELANVSFINQLEALTAEQATAINNALASDPENHTGISLLLPNATPAA